MERERVPVRVTTTVEYNDQKRVHVSYTTDMARGGYADEATKTGIRQMIRKVAESAAEPFAARPSKYTDAVFATNVPPTPGPADDRDSDDEDDYDWRDYE